jgi:chromosome segregation ATPase
MTGEISLSKKLDEDITAGDLGLLSDLEKRISGLLMKYQELAKERDELAAALKLEREKVSQTEKKLELLTQDRERVKTRIDQLLHRLKGIDF